MYKKNKEEREREKKTQILWLEIFHADIFHEMIDLINLDRDDGHKKWLMLNL